MIDSVIVNNNSLWLERHTAQSSNDCQRHVCSFNRLTDHHSSDLMPKVTGAWKVKSLWCEKLLAQVHGCEPRLELPGEESGNRPEDGEAVRAAAAAPALQPANEDSDELGRALTRVAQTTLSSLCPAETLPSAPI